MLTADTGLDPRVLETAGRLLLRSEGAASSRIEAIDAPVGLVAVAVTSPTDVRGPAAWVGANLRAIDAALAHRGPLTVAGLHAWHVILMAGADLAPGLVGAWWDRLGWIGGPVPHRAAHVAAPPGEIDELMADLVAYANRTDLDPVAQAAVVHAQFETIHPYADGNGRLGRLLIGWVLRRRLGLRVPPPVSLVFLRDVGGYLAGLTRWRTEGPSPWVEWFAGAVERAARSATATMRAVAELVAAWPARLTGVRADATAHRLLDLVPSRPALDVATVAALCDVSVPAARGAITTLVDAGVLRPVDVPVSGTAGRPRQWWVAGELLDLLVR